MLRAINISGVAIDVARTFALFRQGQTRSWSWAVLVLHALWFELHEHAVTFNYRCTSSQNSLVLKPMVGYKWKVGVRPCPVISGSGLTHCLITFRKSLWRNAKTLPTMWPHGSIWYRYLVVGITQHYSIPIPMSVLSPKNRNYLGMACHTPPLKKAKEQGEMPLPSLGLIPLKRCYHLCVCVCGCVCVLVYVCVCGCVWVCLEEECTAETKGRRRGRDKRGSRRIETWGYIELWETFNSWVNATIKLYICVLVHLHNNWYFVH